MWSASILVTIATIGSDAGTMHHSHLLRQSGTDHAQTRMNPRRFYQPAVNEGWVDPASA